MGFLFGNYSKPGPGVSKDEPKKTGAALYFQLFFRHFWDFIKENLMYVIASIPMIVIAYFSLTFFDLFSMQKFAIENDLVMGYESFKVLVVMLFLIFCGSGPASAAMAYMMRCVTREEHCFLWSDFVDKFKENFKQSIILAIMDIVLLLFIMPVALKFYYMQYTDTQSTLWLVIFAVLTAITVFYIMMHSYFYQFAVTFELKFKHLIKNSFIMTIAKLPNNIVVIAIPLVLTYLLSTFVNTPYVILLAVFGWVSFMRYPMEFLASRMIYKELLAPKPVEEEEEVAEETEEETANIE